MLLEKKLLTLATKQFTKYVDMNDNVYDRIPKGQYPSVYGFAADDAVNLSSPHCILPMLIKEYEETSYYCAADDDFLMQIYVYDDLATSKWQYSIHMALTKIHREYARKVYEPNRYLERFQLLQKSKTRYQAHYKMGFHYRVNDGWHCIAEHIKSAGDDLALSSERDLFVQEVVADLNRCITTGEFVSQHLEGIQVGSKGHYSSFVVKQFGVYQIDIEADKPFTLCVTVYKNTV